MNKMQFCSHDINAKEFIFICLLTQLDQLSNTLCQPTMNSIIQRPCLFTSALSSEESLLTIINFIDCTDLQTMYQAIQSSNITLPQTTTNIIRSFIFTKKYLTKVDRTMSYFIYENPLAHNIDSLSASNIALNALAQPQIISHTFERLFNNLQSKCKMTPDQVQTIKMIVTEPDLPLPVSLRSNLGEHCSSNFQLFVCSKIAQPFYSSSESSEFSDFKTFLSSNEEKYIKSIMKNSNASNSIIKNLKQLYETPETFVENLSQTDEPFTEDNHIYNFFVTLVQITKNLIKTIKLRLSSVNSDPYTYFTEFLLRYSLYKNYVLQLQETLGSVLDSFKSILEDSFNLNLGKNHPQTELSLWKILIKTFANSMESQIYHCLPIYLNLAHKTKLKWNNKLYAKHNPFHSDNLTPEMQQFDGSPVLEYLLEQENIDNAPVFLSDFMEMLVDLSVDESNVLFCGSSKQKIGNKYFEKLERILVQSQVDLIKRMIEQSKNSEIEQESQEEFTFLQKHLNVKARTLKLLVKELDHEMVKIDFSRVDQKLNQVSRKYLGLVQDMESSKGSRGSSLTADSEESGSDLDFEGLEYFSEVDEEEVQQEIDF